MRAKIKTACASCSSFQQHFGVGSDQASASLGWKSGWSAASDAVLDFFGHVLFSMKYHESLRAALRQAKSVEDCLDADSKLGEACREVKELLEKERLAAAENAPAPVPADSTAASETRHETLSQQSVALQEFARSRGLQNLDNDKLVALKGFENKARVLVKSNVTLHVFVDKEKELMSVISGSPAGTARGKDGSWVGIFVDPAHIGEPATAPHARVAPCNVKYLKNMIGSIVKTRDAMQTTLHPRDLFFLFDTGVRTHQSKMMGCILNNEGNPMACCTTNVHITYDENAMRDRRKSQRTNLDQVENLTLVTSEDFSASMVQRNRKHFPGTNFGNVVGPVKLDPPGELWQLSIEENEGLAGFRIC